MRIRTLADPRFVMRSARATAFMPSDFALLGTPGEAQSTAQVTAQEPTDNIQLRVSGAIETPFKLERQAKPPSCDHVIPELHREASG